MNTRVKSNVQPMKPSKVEVQVQMEGGKTTSIKTCRRSGSVRERKMALQQDVEKLRKRLKHEENVHRALERAFNRPPGALPRLPPYLPPTTLELLAEVAVLEEEVVRLEEQVVHFRQGLYQEAVYISSSKRNFENSLDFQEPSTGENKASKLSSPQIEINASTPIENSPIVSVLVGKDNQSSSVNKNKYCSPNPRSQTVNSLSRRSTVNSMSPRKRLAPKKIEFEGKSMESANVDGKNNLIQEKVDSDPNKISESILKCLMNIFKRMSSTRSRSMTETLPSLTTNEIVKETEFKDPYNICFKYDKRDVGAYKNLDAIDATSINKNRTANSVFLIQRLKLLLGKLASVNLTSLTHQEKLAFWINIYNSCMMNAFLEHGIPESPEMVVQLMQKATINVGGHYLNAISIEHFILRLPYHSQFTFAKGAKNDEITARSVFGLELSEPLVTFALSCGSWSSPAVRIYTGSQVENELENAKKEYLQAAIAISTAKKMVAIPKLLDWYMLDFSKDMDSLLDWVCLQLPNETGKQAMKCLERNKSVPLSHCLHVIPYEFRFRDFIARRHILNAYNGVQYHSQSPLLALRLPHSA